MAAADGRNSPIDWDAERRLAELGYTFEDTDEGNEFLNLVSSPELNMEMQDHQLRQNDNRSEIFQDYEPQVDGVSKSFGALTTKAKVQEATPKPVKEKRRMMAPYLPGTSRTPAYNLQTNDKKEVVLNRQPKPFAHRNRKDKGAEDYHGGSNNQSEEDSDEERNVTPAVYKWEDTEVYRKAMERKTEEEERKRKARAASAAYGSNPDERPLRFRDGVVRATTWKTSPVPLQTDYTCRDAGVTKGRGLPKKLKSSLQETRERDVGLLAREPKPGDGVVRVGITLPSGKRIQRNFYKTDSLKVLRAFVWSHEEVPDSFELYTSYPRRKIEIDSSSLDQASVGNEMIHVVAVK